MEALSGFDFPQIINDDVTFIRSKLVATHSRLRVQAICPLCPLVEGDCFGHNSRYPASRGEPSCTTLLARYNFSVQVFGVLLYLDVVIQREIQPPG